MQEKHTNIIKDGVVLREIWLKQALVLLSQVHHYCNTVCFDLLFYSSTSIIMYQGEYQGAHKLLNQALESCQVSKYIVIIHV